MNALWKIAHKWSKNGGVRKHFSRIIEVFLYIVNSNSVSVKASIGTNTIFHHHGVGCVVHDNAVIGDDCHIFQNVTLGSKWSHGKLDGGAPIIGNNVLIGAGAVVLGNIKVGDNVDIGANAVVIKDIPDNSIAVGVPARIISKG